jgi:hypothetical protein
LPESAFLHSFSYKAINLYPIMSPVHYAGRA